MLFGLWSTPSFCFSLSFFSLLMLRHSLRKPKENRTLNHVFSSSTISIFYYETSEKIKNRRCILDEHTFLH